jgi:monomeric sarcosine oxidase
MAESFDIAVVGAGVFGSWCAYQLRQAGAKVALIDAYGPANSRASSGGESRILRLGYGADEIYTRSAQRSFALWTAIFQRISPDQNRSTQELFRQTGVLWLAHAGDTYCEATVANLEKVGARYERFNRDELTLRYPQLSYQSVDWGVLEVEAGVLMARRAVQAISALAQSDGVTYFQELVLPPQTSKELQSVSLGSGQNINAGKFIFACGPWLPKVFPRLLADLFHVTKQEVFFFGVPAGDTRFEPAQLPAWIDFHDLLYGLPDLDHRGFKVAIDAHGPRFDPDTGERVASAEGLETTRRYLAQRVPALANAPLLETRVCQYENTSNGDFLIDVHPEISNVWLVGGGSGHGFKHGPAVGEYLVQMISGGAVSEPRYALATKQKIQERKVY